MNRRSLIKHAAIAAPATLLASSELSAQPRGSKSNIVVTKAAKQAWRYRFVPSTLDACQQAGLEMWEAVGMLENGVILFKQPA